jgi:hypothetical protein
MVDWSVDVHNRLELWLIAPIGAESLGTTSIFGKKRVTGQKKDKCPAVSGAWSEG